VLSGPVVGMVWEGLDAVKTGRKMLGATNPLASEPGTIRGDYALQVGMVRLRPDLMVIADKTERLPRIRLRRERTKGDCSLVPQVRLPLFDDEVC
jgi:hypothetical protein